MNKQLEALIAEMKAAAEKATPGPWYVHDKPCENGNYGIDTSDNEWLAEAVVWWGFSRESIWREEDARYIALANPANFKLLIAALEQSQQYAKQRDEENQDLMLTIGRLRVERESEQAQQQEHTSIDMSDAEHFTITRLHEIIYGKPLKGQEAKLLARFMHDVKQRKSASSPTALKLPAPAAWRNDNALCSAHKSITTDIAAARNWIYDSCDVSALYTQSDVIKLVRDAGLKCLGDKDWLRAGGTVEGE